MKVNGHNICDTLKAIRKQIADANEIEYSPEECHFKGECNGTCPKCEQDVRNLEHELKHRQMAGKTIKVAGIAVGFVAMTACSDGKPQRSISADTLTDNTVEIKEPTPSDCRLVGDISLNHKGNSADEEEILIDGEVSNGTSTVEVTRQANSKEKSAGTPAKKSKQSKTAIIQPAITSDSTENRHDYRINIKYKDTDIAIQLPAPDSLNNKIVAYIGDKKKAYISDAILYEILCSARYFDFFDKEDLNYIPLLKKYKTPTDYTYYFKNQDSIPARVKSTYKVVLNTATILE